MGLKGDQGAYKKLVEEALVGVYLIQEGRFVYCNPRMGEIFGYAPEEIIQSKTVEDLVAPTDYSRVKGNLQKREEGGMPSAHYTFQGRRSDGRLIHLEVHGSRIMHEDRPAVIGSLLDITERVIADRQRAELLERERVARAEAEEANRAKDLFLAMLSHELRTPLTAILTWAQMLRRGGLSGEKTARALALIEENAKTQAQLINDILDVSRIKAGKFFIQKEFVDPVRAVQAAIDSIQTLADAKSIRMSLNVQGAVGWISADRARFQQILWNLLSNAIKFTPNGGAVTVGIRRLNEKMAEISLRDTGKGIRPDFLPHVFDYFSQADSSSTRLHGGLGLGLTIVRHLVEMHGGTVVAQSAGEGKGSTFIVTLPLAPGQKLQSEEGARLDRSASILAGMKILLVDDDPACKEAFAEALAFCGAEVRTAGSVKQGFELFSEFQPAVVVSDIAMPGEDGYSLIRRIRALSSRDGGDTPAVALTAFAGEKDRDDAISAGFQAHVAKPVDFQTLAQLIQALVH